MKVYVVVEVWKHNECYEHVIDGVYLNVTHATRSIAKLGVRGAEELTEELLEVDGQRADQINEDGQTTAYIEAWEAD